MILHAPLHVLHVLHVTSNSESDIRRTTHVAQASCQTEFLELTKNVLFLKNPNDDTIMQFSLLDSQNSYLGLILPGMVVSQEEGKSHSQTRQLFPSPSMAFHQLSSWFSLGHNQEAAFSTERPVFLKHSINHPLSHTTTA